MLLIGASHDLSNLALLLYYCHEKNPRYQTCLWRALWKRDTPLHFGSVGKGFISFGADRTDGSLVSLCTRDENEFSSNKVCLFRQMLRLIYPFTSVASSQYPAISLIVIECRSDQPSL
ncbi:hypothetical protein AVEN_19813-1 [Araneus ventricosus]|uniref:Uncharacterized protein n=1 Tax=Araneus ventricosus TaxID=182803 RepID=A0A4Y2S4A5_ARAVE|nr:hypothetical protein AVEN_172395-1 [Araneus ventricosus]GBN82421.1 hypothetical protein AVEN_172989-1 [Araneus ventricosus]GBN82691.1 hypothetical protein AVEN_12423-1 [Araneus ventricosus]GBN82692.1 hypothetical protein AVEN_19813-1 [Araneus ventricosus]